MFKKIKRFLLNIFYGLPFGLRGADNEILGHKSSSNGEEITIQQNSETNKLSDALLRGQETQEVEELRYRTYKVAQESKNYSYLGDGVAVKREEKIYLDKFIVNNHVICEGVFHELQRINDYGIDRYVIKINYSDIPRFKLEKYCNKAEIDLKNKKIFLFFEKNTDKPEIRMFHNELKNVINGKKSDIMEYPMNLSFNYDENMTNYKFFRLKYNQIEENKYEFVICYGFDEYSSESILEKYYSESMEEKYRTKAPKKRDAELNEYDNFAICSSCGEKMDKIDGDITAKSFGYPLCKKCLMKINELKE